MGLFLWKCFSTCNSFNGPLHSHHYLCHKSHYTIENSQTRTISGSSCHPFILFLPAFSHEFPYFRTISCFRQQLWVIITKKVLREMGQSCGSGVSRALAIEFASNLQYNYEPNCSIRDQGPGRASKLEENQKSCEYSYSLFHIAQI